jgi:hypothetical protein
MMENVNLPKVELNKPELEFKKATKVKTNYQLALPKSSEPLTESF